MTIQEAINDTAERLQQAGVGNARREAASLLAIAIERPATFLIAHPEYALSGGEQERLREMSGRREQRVPFQHITRRQEFYGLEFEVSPDVLIPRPETEILVEKAIEILSEIEHPSFLELGVGSGCISISLLKNLPSASAVAVDRSPLALAVARSNADRHTVADRIEFVESDLFDRVTGPFDVIVTNPPYIPDRDIAELQAEVRDFEPLLALAGGSDGLDIIRRIVKDGQSRLIPGGWLLSEIGYGQSQAVRSILESEQWTEISFLKDLQQIPRVAVIRKPL